MTTTDKIFVQVGDEKIELSGEDKNVFLSRIAEDVAIDQAQEEAKLAKESAKAATLQKLGLTAEELAALI